MFQETILQKRDQFTKIFDQLTHSISWSVDKRVRMSITSQFVSTERDFDPKAYLFVIDFIKREEGWFSSLPYNTRYILAALLITQFEDPYKAYSELKECYEVLTNNKFRKGPYTYLSAFSLLTHKKENGNLAEQARRAMEIYKAIRSRHFFLTSSDDYPLSVLLSQSNRSIDSLMEDIEYFYDFLSKHGFRKGNDLQFLSHILTQGQPERREQLAETTARYLEAFQSEKVKIKGMHYPALGVLALIDIPENTLADVIKAYSHFNESKLFRWYKDMSLLVAIQLYVQQIIADNSVLSVGIATSIQTILQAQQAAMIAVISAGAVAAASSSNGGGN
ncbi:Uncharacterised protein [Chlamydia abortus]|nr:Uncharacterised protein [Chlamydia abortus]